jgi:hypothetical protein
VGPNCIDKQMIMCSAKLLEGFRPEVYGFGEEPVDVVEGHL